MDTKLRVYRKTRRATLTLEADVADYIVEKLSKNRDLKKKDLVNNLLRKGILADSEELKIPPFVIKPFKTKLAPGMTVEKLEEIMRRI